MKMALPIALQNLNPNYSRVLEFGVFSGESIRLIRQTLGLEYSIFGFDTFTGLPEDWIGTGLPQGYFNCDGNIPNIENVILIKGNFSETLPEFLKYNNNEPCALIHIDCDLYSSTKTIFEYITPSISEGTIIVFDEWFYASDHGLENLCEQKAFYEWVLSYKIDFTFIDTNKSKYCEQKIIKIL